MMNACPKLSGRQIDVFIHLTSGIEIQAGNVDETMKDLGKIEEWVNKNIAADLRDTEEE